MWIGHASFRIVLGGKVIYIDPWKLSTVIPAHLILITHSHYDHFSLPDIDAIVTSGTQIFCSTDCVSLLRSRGYSVTPVRPNEIHQVEDITIRTLPAYNLHKDYHPRYKHWLGYLLTSGDKSILHAGDTDAIEEVKGVTASIGLLPVSGVYVMSPEEAVVYAKNCQLKTVIPMHYGDFVGSAEDAEKFQSLFDGETILLEPTP
ncbi:MAG: MBL fold metallo-hydrolase [bacterium]